MTPSSRSDRAHLCCILPWQIAHRGGSAAHPPTSSQLERRRRIVDVETLQLGVGQRHISPRTCPRRVPAHERAATVAGHRRAPASQGTEPPIALSRPRFLVTTRSCHKQPSRRARPLSFPFSPTVGPRRSIRSINRPIGRASRPRPSLFLETLCALSLALSALQPFPALHTATRPFRLFLLSRFRSSSSRGPNVPRRPRRSSPVRAPHPPPRPGRRS